jgi:hypothetical protein
VTELLLAAILSTQLKDGGASLLKALGILAARPRHPGPVVQRPRSATTARQEEDDEEGGEVWPPTLAVISFLGVPRGQETPQAHRRFCDYLRGRFSRLQRRYRRWFGEEEEFVNQVWFLLAQDGETTFVDPNSGQPVASPGGPQPLLERVIWRVDCRGRYSDNRLKNFIDRKRKGIGNARKRRGTGWRDPDVEWKDFDVDLDDGLGYLSKRQIHIVRLFLKGHKVPRIAETLKLPKAEVYASLRLAKRCLESYLQDR